MQKKTLQAISLALTISALVLTTTAAPQFDLNPVKIEDLEKITRDQTLSLVVFADLEKSNQKLVETEFFQALNLLKDDAKHIKIYQTSAQGREYYQKKYSVTDEPSLRFFWKGIMMPLPTSKNFKGILIYRWIKMHIRASKIPKVEIMDTETFFEQRKERDPYIIVGLGPRDSVEGNFLGEFSLIPKTPFKIYFLEESLSKKLFQSIGLSGAKFNILLINNVAKKIQEYSQDLDYFKFNQWLEKSAREPGAFQFNKRNNYVSNTIGLRRKVMTVFLPYLRKKYRKNKFRASIARVAERFDYSILWGRINSEYVDEIDYVDCQEEVEKSKKICAYLYHDFHDPQQRKRYKLNFKKFDEDNLEEDLGNFLKDLNGKEHFFSDEKPLKGLSPLLGVKTLSRNNYGKHFGDQSTRQRDALILSYYICGSNCQEKLSYIVEFLGRMTESTRDQLDVFVCDLKKNEMPDEFYQFSRLGYIYVRKTDSKRLYSLDGVNSSYDLVDKIKGLASFEVVGSAEEDSELEDLV